MIIASFVFGGNSPALTNRARLSLWIKWVSTAYMRDAQWRDVPNRSSRHWESRRWELIYSSIETVQRCRDEDRGEGSDHLRETNSSASAREPAETREAHLSLKLSFRRSLPKVTSLEILHQVSTLLSTCFTDSTCDEIRDDVVWLNDGENELRNLADG